VHVRVRIHHVAIPIGHLRLFYVVIGLVTLAAALLNAVHTVTPVRALFYSAVLNGAIAPPLIIVLLLMCNNRKIVKERGKGWLSNIVGGLAAVLMLLAMGLMIRSLVTGTG